MSLSITELLNAFINGLSQAGNAGQVHDRSVEEGGGSAGQVAGYTGDPKPTAPKAQGAYNSGAFAFCSKDWMIASLESFARIPDEDLRSMKEMKQLAEAMLSNCLGFQVVFPDDPAEAKDFALRFAAAMRDGHDNQTAYKIARGDISVEGTSDPDPQGAVEAETGNSGIGDPAVEVEPAVDPRVDGGGSLEEERIAEDPAPVEEVGSGYYTEAEVNEFVALLERMAVPTDPLEGKRQRDQMSEDEKKRLGELHKKFAYSNEPLPQRVIDAWNENYDGISANMKRIPQIAISMGMAKKVPNPLDSDPKVGIRQLYDFAEANN